MMVVPAQWQGSVEHFYHFFLGYFMPLVLWQERTGTMSFEVRDCGPMNPWFSLLRPGSDVDLMPPGVMLQRVLTHLQERQILHGWDDPQRFHRASLAEFSGAVLDRLDAPRQLDGLDRIVVLDRRPGPAFFSSAGAEVSGSGAEWRSVPNMAEVAAALEPLGQVELVDAAGLTPQEQVRRFAGARLLVAQHGAGLANIVWLPPGSGVVEIQPPLPPIIDTIFPNLAAAVGVDHVLVPQADLHAPADPATVAVAAQALLASPGSFVPAMPGRLPTRILRQLPRRL